MFVLTFETEFFVARHGFTEIEGTLVTARSDEMCRPMTSGVADLDLLRQAQHPRQLPDAVGAGQTKNRLISARNGRDFSSLGGATRRRVTPIAASVPRHYRA